MSGKDTAGPSTRSVHAGSTRDPDRGLLVTPLYLSSTFFARNTQELVEYVEGRRDANFYSRYSNPTVEAVEERLAALEGAEKALCFGSGMAAVSSLFLSQLSQGDHLVATRDLYGGTHELLAHALPRWGIDVTLTPSNETRALDQAIRPNTRLVYTETPTNPLLAVVDLEAVATISRRHGVPCAVDSTFASPMNQKPIAFGFDFVVHSATKYLGGHCDLLGGVVMGSRDRMREVWRYRKLMGGILDPHPAFLLERGLKSLSLRMERHNENGLQIARHLADHSKVKRVNYPGLPEHPGHEIAARQMSGFGGVISFELDATREETARFVDSLSLAFLAPSLGGVETLVTQPALTSHYHLKPEERAAQGISDSLVRLSAGIEDAVDLIRDLDLALETIQP